MNIDTSCWLELTSVDYPNKDNIKGCFPFVFCMCCALKVCFSCHQLLVVMLMQANDGHPHRRESVISTHIGSLLPFEFH